MITKRELLWIGGAAALCGWPMAVAAQNPDPVVARIQAFYDSLQAALASAPSDPKQRVAAVSDAVSRTFDLAAMTRLAIGPQWSKIPSAKQASIQDAFGRYFVATYANRLALIAGGRFEVLPKVEKRGANRLVHTRVIDAKGQATPVDYLIDADGEVIDVFLSGTVSELASRRAELTAALKAGGPDGLEATLRKQTEQALGGGT